MDVAGDFYGWFTTASPTINGADGTFTPTLAVLPGRHRGRRDRRSEFTTDERIMRRRFPIAVACAACLSLPCRPATAAADGPPAVVRGPARATATVAADGDLRTYRLTTTADLRDAGGGRTTVAETAGHAACRTGSPLFDGLYALAAAEAVQDSVDRISDGAYANGRPIPIDAFQTGASWRYVWTRDVSYSVDLGLAQFDPARAVRSLLFKASGTKPAVAGEFREQVVQDTGSGGSYPVSTDRVVWALAAGRAMDFLAPADRDAFAGRAFPVLCDTAELDRRLAFDARAGLYRGEQSFLDWREQTYPAWTKFDVLPIAMSKALSTNALHYRLLRTAAGLARGSARADLSARYDGWADALKAAINDRFWDARAGLYSTYLLSDGVTDLRAERYDLLGECLTVLFGIADGDRAAAVLAHYPTGPFGPPVVWPQERSVPIYHNQAMWPFVTAYWARAGARAGNGAVVEAAVRSLHDQAALNSSNMENYDLVTGRARVAAGPRPGPVINSRRQLWSVAGYLSMVQDVVFGTDVSAAGIRFQPCITPGMRDLLGITDVIELRRFAYRGTRNTVRVHLPPAGGTAAGIYPVDHVLLNAAPAPAGYAAADALRPDNVWDVYLNPAAADAGPLRRVDVTDDRAIFGPLAPRWAPAGLEVRDGHATLRFEQDGPPAEVTFTVYRDGREAEAGVTATTWTDPQPDAGHTYAVVAVDRRSGNASHPTPFRSDVPADQIQRVPAADLTDRGGAVPVGDHFERWAAVELTSRPVRVARDGRYAVRVEFANGNGPVNTGLCCGVKRLEVRSADGTTVAGDTVVLPQSGSWQRWDLSSPVLADLRAGRAYTVALCGEGVDRNMSGLAANVRYSGGIGGGDQGVNQVSVRAIQLGPVGTGPVTATADDVGGHIRPVASDTDHDAGGRSRRR